MTTFRATHPTGTTDDRHGALMAAERRARNLADRLRINDRHYGVDARPDLRVLLAEARAEIQRLRQTA